MIMIKTILVVSDSYSRAKHLAQDIIADRNEMILNLERADTVATLDNTYEYIGARSIDRIRGSDVEEVFFECGRLDQKEFRKVDSVIEGLVTKSSLNLPIKYI